MIFQSLKSAFCLKKAFIKSVFFIPDRSKNLLQKRLPPKNYSRICFYPQKTGCRKKHAVYPKLKIQNVQHFIKRKEFRLHLPQHQTLKNGLTKKRASPKKLSFRETLKPLSICRIAISKKR
ncbi:hypothetical protein ACWA1F_23910 [Flavobacterium sp. 3-218]